MTAGFAPPWAMTLQLIRSKNTPTQAKAAWVGHPAGHKMIGFLPPTLSPKEGDEGGAPPINYCIVLESKGWATRPQSIRHQEQW